MSKEDALRELGFLDDHEYSLDQINNYEYSIKNVDERVKQLGKVYDPNYKPKPGAEAIAYRGKEERYKHKYKGILECAEMLKELNRQAALEKEKNSLIEGTDIHEYSGKQLNDGKKYYGDIIRKQVNENKKLQEQLAQLVKAQQAQQVKKPIAENTKKDLEPEEVLEVNPKNNQLDLSAVSDQMVKKNLNTTIDQSKMVNSNGFVSDEFNKIEADTPLNNSADKNVKATVSPLLNTVDFNPTMSYGHVDTQSNKQANEATIKPVSQSNVQKGTVPNQAPQTTKYYDEDDEDSKKYDLNDPSEYDFLSPEFKNEKYVDEQNADLVDIFKKITAGSKQLEPSKIKKYSTKAIQVTRNFVNNLKNGTYKYKLKNKVNKIISVPVGYFKKMGERIMTPFNNQKIYRENLDKLSDAELAALAREYDKNGVDNFTDDTKKVIEKKVLEYKVERKDYLQKHVVKEKEAISYIGYRIGELNKMINNLKDNEAQKQVYLNLIDGQYKGMTDRITKLKNDEAELAASNALEPDDDFIESFFNNASSSNEEKEYDQESNEYKLYDQHKQLIAKLEQLESSAVKGKDDKKALDVYLEIEKGKKELDKEEEQLPMKGRSL